YIDSLLKYPADGFPRTLQAWEDALHPNDHSRVVAALQEHAEKGTLFDVIYRIQDANGDYRWWHDVGQAILDEAGKPTRMLGACVDVTEKHLAEELMVESRQMLLSVLDTIPVRVFWKDLNLKYLGCNKSFVKDAGYDAPQEVIGLDDYQMGWKDQAHIYRRDDFSVIESGVAKLNYEEPQTSPAGETLFLRTSKIPLRDANQQIKGILGTYEDITEEKKSEAETMRLRDQLQQAQKIESVGRLAGGVAHDFNNMLGVILGHVEMALQQAAVGHPLHQHLDGIRRAAQRSADLTRQLLAFARRQTIQPKAIDLNVALTGMQKMLERLIGEDVELQWNLGKELWMVCIDPVQIDQVLANLIVNARDALAGHGSIITGTTNITIRGDDKSFPAEIKPGDYVMLSVFDSGKGISPEALEHIFEPFYTTKGVGNGTGLGLSVIYGIVKQNNGYIDVKSKSDKGTLFRIFLPRFDSLITPIDKSPEVHAPRKGRETILLVEDEQMILDLGEAELLEQGYQVLTASTPQEALDRVQHYEGEIELLITDVIMPLMNGKELKEKLLLSRPHLQCLFMSGYTADIIAHSGALDKDVHFIQKPFTVQSFANVVRQILDSGNSPLMNVKT
ncbi:MAG: PAS domain-containing hybrid sensor histidine kinase/response regulator, partial [Calditrichaeota bacterium]